MALTDALEEFEGAAVIVTHNEDILRRTAQRLIVFQGEAPFVFEGTYDEFLDSVGWEEEADLIPRGKKKSKPSVAKGREQKREKAQVLQERSRQLTPLKEQVSSLERAIADLEKGVAKAQETLASASASGDSAGIKSASQELARAQKELEQQLSTWERAVRETQEVERTFSEQLKEFQE